MQKFWKSNEFKKIKEEWDRKLENSGFKDAEKELNGELVLKAPSVCEGKFAGVYRFNSKEKIEEKEEYYRLLSQCFEEEKNFDDEVDKIIMSMTVSGKKVKEISDELKGRLEKGRQRSKHNRHTICFVRRRYETKWGIKSWQPEQMVSKKVKKTPIPS